METKKSLKRKINSLKKSLSDPALDAHFDALHMAADSFIEEKTSSSSELSLPSEIKNQEDLALFSDGACRGNPGPGAWAYIVQDISGEVIAKDQDVAAKTTNNRMELAGAIEALKFLKDSKKSGTFYLYTDSRYVVDGIEKWVAGWKARGWKKADKKEPENLELWKLLDQLNNELKVNFKWVKGHAGHPQNELCDQMANEALDEAGY
tara:strand:- start:38128 stop:38748 length:621 start_codon:yes stop_codon:yes gene_type:complete